jgi:hypothetical protein
MPCKGYKLFRGSKQLDRDSIHITHIERQTRGNDDKGIVPIRLKVEDRLLPGSSTFLQVLHGLLEGHSRIPCRKRNEERQEGHPLRLLKSDRMLDPLCCLSIKLFRSLRVKCFCRPGCCPFYGRQSLELDPAAHIHTKLWIDCSATQIPPSIRGPYQLELIFRTAYMSWMPSSALLSLSLLNRCCDLTCKNLALQTRPHAFDTREGGV